MVAIDLEVLALVLHPVHLARIGKHARGLVAQQIAMTATWYQSEQAEKDLAQTRREEFFNATPPSTSGGQEMEPRW